MLTSRRRLYSDGTIIETIPFPNLMCQEQQVEFGLASDSYFRPYVSVMFQRCINHEYASKPVKCIGRSEPPSSRPWNIAIFLCLLPALAMNIGGVSVTLQVNSNVMKVQR